MLSLRGTMENGDWLARTCAWISADDEGVAVTQLYLADDFLVCAIAQWG
jgi:hypothetical protein